MKYLFLLFILYSCTTAKYSESKTRSKEMYRQDRIMRKKMKAARKRGARYMSSIKSNEFHLFHQT
jgi:hypothetical protein